MTALQKNGCLTGLISVFVAIGIVVGILTFIVWSPCRDDWPSDDSTTEPVSTMTTPLFSSSEEPTMSTTPTSASSDGKIENEKVVPLMYASSAMKKGAQRVESRHPRSPLRLMAPPVL